VIRNFLKSFLSGFFYRVSSTFSRCFERRTTFRFSVIQNLSSEIVPMQFLPIFRAQSEWGPGSSRVTKLAKVQYCENNCNHVQILHRCSRPYLHTFAARQKQYLVQYSFIKQHLHLQYCCNYCLIIVTVLLCNCGTYNGVVSPHSIYIAVHTSILVN